MLGNHSSLITVQRYRSSMHTFLYNMLHENIYRSSMHTFLYNMLHENIFFLSASRTYSMFTFNCYPICGIYGFNIMKNRNCFRTNFLNSHQPWNLHWINLQTYKNSEKIRGSISCSRKEIKRSNLENEFLIKLWNIKVEYLRKND